MNNMPIVRAAANLFARLMKANEVKLLHFDNRELAMAYELLDLGGNLLSVEYVNNDDASYIKCLVTRGEFSQDFTLTYPKPTKEEKLFLDMLSVSSHRSVGAAAYRKIQRVIKEQKNHDYQRGQFINGM